MMLNVGCGSDHTGTVRVDLKKTPAANLLADAQQLPFRDQAFQIVECISVLEHIPNWSQALREICRVSRKMVLIEVPVNSDLRKTEFLRLLLPTPKNIRLFFSAPRRARETFWQFDPEKMMPYLEAYGFQGSFQKIIQIYEGVPSRCWRILGFRRSPGA